LFAQIVGSGDTSVALAAASAVRFLSVQQRAPCVVTRMFTVLVQALASIATAVEQRLTGGAKSAPLRNSATLCPCQHICNTV
jgi:hypothetical protein